MSLEDTLSDTIKKIVNDELDKRRPKTNLIPVEEFCKKKKISRTSVWRARKAGTVKTVYIGDRVFIDLNQFTGV